MYPCQTSSLLRVLFFNISWVHLQRDPWWWWCHYSRSYTSRSHQVLSGAGASAALGPQYTKLPQHQWPGRSQAQPTGRFLCGNSKWVMWKPKRWDFRIHLLHKAFYSIQFWYQCCITISQPFTEFIVEATFWHIRGGPSFWPNHRCKHRCWSEITHVYKNICLSMSEKSLFMYLFVTWYFWFGFHNWGQAQT